MLYYWIYWLSVYSVLAKRTEIARGFDFQMHNSHGQVSSGKIANRYDVQVSIRFIVVLDFSQTPINI